MPPLFFFFPSLSQCEQAAKHYRLCLGRGKKKLRVTRGAGNDSRKAYGKWFFFGFIFGTRESFWIEIRGGWTGWIKQQRSVAGPSFAVLYGICMCVYKQTAGAGRRGGRGGRAGRRGETSTWRKAIRGGQIITTTYVESIIKSSSDQIPSFFFWFFFPPTTRVIHHP